MTWPRLLRDFCFQLANVAFIASLLKMVLTCGPIRVENLLQLLICEGSKTLGSHQLLCLHEPVLHLSTSALSLGAGKAGTRERQLAQGQIIAEVCTAARGDKQTEVQGARAQPASS